MNKKLLFCAASVLLVILLSLSSLFMASAAGEPQVPEETGATFTTNKTEPTDTSEPSSLKYKAGDVDGNGVVDINDATIYQLTLSGRQEVTPAFELNSETILDKKRNIIDVTGIQYYISDVFDFLPVYPDSYSEIIRP